MADVLRMCIVCRTMKPKRELYCIKKSKDGVITVDKTAKAAGRGAYICKEGQCREKMIKTRALERAFHQNISAEQSENIMKELI
ncbi:MAG: YlxR family protein [Clostridia bacterium]|nr:YlxR family protein [Clostridia bacterium]